MTFSRKKSLSGSLLEVLVPTSAFRRCRLRPCRRRWRRRRCRRQWASWSNSETIDAGGRRAYWRSWPTRLVLFKLKRTLFLALVNNKSIQYWHCLTSAGCRANRAAFDCAASLTKFLGCWRGWWDLVLDAAGLVGVLVLHTSIQQINSSYLVRRRSCFLGKRT